MLEFTNTGIRIDACPKNKYICNVYHIGTH